MKIYKNTTNGYFLHTPFLNNLFFQKGVQYRVNLTLNIFKNKDITILNTLNKTIFEFFFFININTENKWSSSIRVNILVSILNPLRALILRINNKRITFRTFYHNGILDRECVFRQALKAPLSNSCLIS